MNLFTKVVEVEVL